MGIEIVTKEDLQVFRQQLLEDLKALLSFKPGPRKEWLRTSEVRKLLNISRGTLHHLQVTGVLKPVKIGGILFYRSSDIEQLFNRKQQ